MIDTDPASPPTSSDVISAIPVPAPSGNEFTVANFNMERFFDTTNDPSKDDVALTPTAFNNRLNKASLAIRNVLQLPDVVGVEEVENLATLQAIATKVNNDEVAAGHNNPNYVAYLEEGNDIGGIDVGFLVKSGIVSVDSVTQYGKDTTYIDPSNGQPALLNDRPSLVLVGTVAKAGTGTLPVTVVVNHLRSLTGVDDPADGPRVREKRRAQAEFLANLLQTLQTDDPNIKLVSIGDYNSFQFNDGYVDMMGTIRGVPTPASEVTLASGDLVNPDLFDLLETASPDQRYSYVFDGVAQELDHILVNPNLHAVFSRYAVARNDADFPEVYRNDPNRPERISDHDMPVAYFSLPALAPNLSGTIVTKAGPTNARVWTVSLTNSGEGTANGTQLDSITLTQTGGAACTPVVNTAFPVSLGTVAPMTTVSTNVTIDFTGCVATARFTVNIPFSANAGAVTGSIVRANQFR
jgi:hypothetical protein